MKRVWGVLAVMIVWTAAAQARAYPTGEMTADVNLRTGPGTSYAVIRVIPQGAEVSLLGRDVNASWLFVAYQGQEGWAFSRYIETTGIVADLPIVAQESTTSSALPATVSSPTDVVSRISGTSRTIFQAGQALGNRSDVFVKVGDSITATDLFLDPIGHGAYDLQGFDYLQPVINYFSQTSVRDHFSFANTSIAARGGFTTADVLNPELAPPGVCQPGETPLACEYRIARPAIALIMLGTNDVAILDAAVFEANLRTIVQISIDNGIIPVLSTIPDRPGPLAERAQTFNRIIERVSRRFDVPLWDFHGALQGLHNQGLSEDDIHPSYDAATNNTAFFTPEGLQYGYNVRNLTALQVLDALWRQVIQR
jgi:uncharacterized protein YraI